MSKVTIKYKSDSTKKEIFDEITHFLFQLLYENNYKGVNETGNFMIKVSKKSFEIFYDDNIPGSARNGYIPDYNEFRDKK